MCEHQTEAINVKMCKFAYNTLATKKSTISRIDILILTK